MDKMLSKRYKIGEVSKITNMPISRLRYYDKAGILSPRWRDETSEYRFYDAYQLEEAYLIEEYQYFGFRLNQIRKLLGDPNHFFENLEEITDIRLQELDAEIAQLQKLQYKLSRMRERVRTQQQEYKRNDYIILPMMPHTYIVSDNYLDLANPAHYEEALSSRIAMHTADRKLPWYLADEYYRLPLNPDKPSVTGRFVIRMTTDEQLKSPLHLLRVEDPYCIKYTGHISIGSIHSHIETMLLEADRAGYAPSCEFCYLGELVLGDSSDSNQPIRQILIPLTKK